MTAATRDKQQTPNTFIIFILDEVGYGAERVVAGAAPVLVDQPASALG